MPEFLTEKNYMDDFKHNENWIFGIKNTSQDNNFINIVSNLINNAYMSGNITSNNIKFISNNEAEMIKLFRNTYLATKIAFCNEIYEYCLLKGINYETVRKIATEDERIGSSHTNVPGHDGKFGYGGTCFPKDISSLLYDINNIGMRSYILDAVVKRNVEHDRKEKDWENNKGESCRLMLLLCF